MPTSPSSPTNLNLADTRKELDLLNKEIFKLFIQRRDLVAKIQNFKEPSSQSFPHFDPQRELQLFKNLLADLKLMSLSELAAFSLLMESQAGAPQKYPQWSEGIHLLETPSCAEHRINPILLKICNAAAFEALKLESTFSFLRSI
ncbi:MAG: chorismate mutase [Bacteriovoracaceae bacterium]|nr:chorismate mutase [Bacteriovoracaceae bacterium]